MKTPHLVAAPAEPAAYETLLQALQEQGLRAGWLLHDDSEPAPLPAALQAASALPGVSRALMVGPLWSVSAKVRRGPTVRSDLLREHFRGCQVVLVVGEGDLPRLEPGEADGWVVTTQHGSELRLSTVDVVQRLRRPRPWGLPPASQSAD